MATIFISYSRESHDKARSIAEDLEALGYQAWYDQALTGGQAWWNQILAEVQKCDIFAFAVEPASLDSAACKREYTYAHNLGKTILPIIVTDGVAEDLLPPALAEIQYVDYRQEDRHSFRALAKALKALPPSAPLPEPLPEPPPAPVSYLGSLKEQVEAPEGLSFAEQTQLVIKLKTGLRNAKDADQVRTLLRVFRSRDDLYAKVADEIDALTRESTTPTAERPVAKANAASGDESNAPPDVVELNEKLDKETVKSPGLPSDSPTTAASSFQPFSHQHFWLSVIGGLLIDAALIGEILPYLFVKEPTWSIPATLIFVGVVVWTKVSERPLYVKLAFVALPLALAFIMPIHPDISYSGTNTMHYWNWPFRFSLALIPFVLTATVLTFSRRSSLTFAWIALGCGLVISVMLSKISWPIWPDLLRLVSLILAAGLLLYLIVLLVKPLIRRLATPK